MMNSETELICQSEQRRDAVRQHADFNGFDYMEVIAPTILHVFFLKKAPEGLSEKNVVVKGGRRPQHRDIQVRHIDIHRQERPDLDDCLHITLNKTGDFSTY